MIPLGEFVGFDRVVWCGGMARVAIWWRALTMRARGIEISGDWGRAAGWLTDDRTFHVTSLRIAPYPKRSTQP